MNSELRSNPARRRSCERFYEESSPRKARSRSIAVAKTFLDEYRARNPEDEVAYLDLLLGFIGFTDVHSILVEPTLGAPDDTALAEAAALAANFGSREAWRMSSRQFGDCSSLRH